ncbi:hypothetical protein BsWGS_22500 [Bradybaena similaris]
MAAAMMSVSESITASMILQQQMYSQQAEPPTSGQQSKGVGFFVQVLLVSALFGIETVIAFEQIYQILFHQFLGVPVSLLSINGIVCGVVSMTLLPLLGYFSDKGSNPMKRKLCALFVGMIMFLCGMLLLIIAGFLKLQTLDAIYWSRHTNSSFNDASLTTPATLTAQGSSSISLNDTTTSQTLVTETTTSHSSEAVGAEPSSDYQVSVTAILSMLAFSCVDIGFDISISLTRAFILASTPVIQHTRLLVMATVSASVAGSTFSLIGCFDFPGILQPIFHVEGVAATLIFFCSLLFCLILTGYSFTIITGHVITKRARELDTQFINNEKTANITVASSDQGTPSSNRRRLLKGKDQNKGDQHSTSRPYVPDILHTEEGDASTRPLLLEDSLKANNYSALSISTSSLLPEYDPHDVHIHDKEISKYRNTPIDNATQCEDINDKEAEVSLLNGDEHKALQEDSDADKRKQQIGHGVSSLLEAFKKSYSMSLSTTQAPLGDFHTRKLENLQKDKPDDLKNGNKLFKNKRLIILCFSCFFTFGSMYTFIIYISNALNIGIFKGDPTALPGTEAYDYYQAGLRTAALGNTVLYVTYMIISINNTRLIKLIGEQVQFVVCHVFMIVSLLTLLLTQRLEIYFVFMVSCGALRTCVFTLPFVLANKFTMTEGASNDGDSDTRKQHLGKVMSLIGFLIPSHYIVISIIMGPLLDATGNVWVPLIYSLCSSIISLLIFISLFFVKN